MKFLKALEIIIRVSSIVGAIVFYYWIMQQRVWGNWGEFWQGVFALGAILIALLISLDTLLPKSESSPSSPGHTEG